MVTINNNQSSATVQNNDIRSSIESSLANALGLHLGKTLCDDAVETIGTILSNFVKPLPDDKPIEYFYVTPLNSRVSSITSKFLRLTSERIVIGNCSDEKSLNYVQENFMCINKGSYKAVVFRAGTAFTFGVLSSMTFKGNPLFAAFDGFRAASYDAIDELREVAELTQNQELKTVIEFVNAHKGFIIEGLISNPKAGANPVKFGQEYYGFLKGYLIDNYAPAIDRKLFTKFADMKPLPNINIASDATLNVKGDNINSLAGVYDGGDEL